MHKYTQNAGDKLPAQPDLSKLNSAVAATHRNMPAIKRAAARRKQNAAAALENPPLAPTELSVHTLDLKPGRKEHDEKALNMRSRCLEVGKSLVARGNIRKELYKAGRKVQNCRIIGLFQEVSPTVHYKIGAALCKQRLCPNCQRVLSAKRRENTLAWFELNREKLRDYFFYHMVLTVPHDSASNLRTGVYTGDLLDEFAKMRGTAKGMGSKERKKQVAWWSSWIAGGFYYVEAKPGKDSPHIHIHCIVLGHKQLWNAKQDSKFKIEAGNKWAEITGNQSIMKGLFIEPVYYINEETKERVNCHFGSSVKLESAVSEAAKYTMKTDVQTLGQFSDDFLADMLTMKNRYYGRFGCLSSRDKSSAKFEKLEMLRTDFKDLEQVTALEIKRLFNPETGEIVDKDSTRLLVTPFRNMKATETAGWVEGTMKPVKEREAGERVVPGEMVYRLEKEVPYAVYFAAYQKQEAIAKMGVSISGEYNSTLDIL